MTLRARVVSGLGWAGAAHWFGTASGLVTVVVLGRLLVPADFAVVAAAGALGALVGIMQESGLAAAVVQHPGDDDRAATTALVLNVVLATLGVAGCVALSPWLADFFHITQRSALAVAFTPIWLRAWSNVPTARVQRALAFKRFAAIEMTGGVAYPAVSIPLAAAGFGPWALVLGQVGAAAAAAVTAWTLVGWRPRRRDFDWQTGRHLAAFGRPILGGNLLAMVNDQVDNWVTGRLYGPGALGLYTMAFRVATLPRTGFSFIVSQVLFPALARLRGDRDRFRMVFLRSVHWVAVFSVPASVGLALLAPELVGAVLGPRWAGAATPARVLAGFALLASLSATTGDVFKATGRSGLIFRIGLVHSVTLWTGLALLGSRGLPYVALAVTLATVASCTTAFVTALAILRLGPAALVGALWAPATATAVMALAVGAVRGSAVAGGTVGLGLLVGLGIIVYTAALAVLAPDDVREVTAALGGARAARRTARAAVG